MYLIRVCFASRDYEESRKEKTERKEKKVFVPSLNTYKECSLRLDQLKTINIFVPTGDQVSFRKGLFWLILVSEIDTGK